MKLAKHRAWSDRADKGLSATLADDRQSVISDVNAGRLELWEVDDGAAWCVTCVTGDELAVCCVQGSGLVELSTVLVEFARRQKLKRVRWFTKRPAMQRLLTRRAHLPVTLAGYVFHVDLQPLH